jgi:hypothetical protein
MIWTIDQQPEDGIMFRGQGTVRVKNRRGETGRATVQYSPVVQVVGPVVEDVERDPEGYQMSEPEVIDRRPTFRNPS